MAVGRQEIKGTKILNEINSSNIIRTEYDTADKTMIPNLKMVHVMNMKMYHTMYMQNSDCQNHKENILIPKFQKYTNTKNYLK